LFNKNLKKIKKLLPFFIESIHAGKARGVLATGGRTPRGLRVKGFSQNSKKKPSEES